MKKSSIDENHQTVAGLFSTPNKACALANNPVELLR
jgi:hypothetical protein